MEALRQTVGDRFATGRFQAARALFERTATAHPMEEFLTLPAYDVLRAGTERTNEPQQPNERN